MNDFRQLTSDISMRSANLNLFNIGFWLLMFSWSVQTLSKTRWQIESQYLSAPLLCVGMFFILIAAFSTWQRSIQRVTPLTQIIFIFLFFWGFVTALRGFSSFEITAFRDNLGIRYFAWAWFMPILMVLPIEPIFLNQLLKTMLNHAKLGFIIFAIAWVPPVHLFTPFNLCWGCSALLIFWHYLSNGVRRAAIAGTFLTLVFAVLASERNVLVGHGFLILSAAYIIMTRKHRFRGQRRFGLIICFLLVYGLVYYASHHERFPFLDKVHEERVQIFKDELFVNTRVSQSGVSLYQDFLNDMSTMDLLFGRGSLGTYRSMESMGLSRSIIECGYFQVILKGGIIMLIPMLLLASIGMMKGLFFSHNWMVKGFAFIIIGWLIEMVPFGVPAAFPRYALFWLSIGVCLNPYLSNMTDEEIERNVLPERAVSFGKSG